MKIAILQPTPFRKGHYYIYTKSLFNEIKTSKHKVKVISAKRTYSEIKNEKSTKLNYNLYSLKGLIIYLILCYLTIFRFIINRNHFNRIILLDCEYSCISILLLFLKLLNWEGKITVQVNAPNFNYDFTKEGFNIFRVLKFIQSYIFKFSLNLLDLKISCLGKWHRNQLSKQLMISKKRIVIIEDGGGGTIKKYNEETLIKKLKNKSIHFPKTNKKVFLLFGNIRKDKGHLFLSKLWKKHFNKPDDPYLWIVGHDEEKISSRILEQDSNNIVLHNSYVPLDLISCIYQKSHFAILPYISSYRGGSGPLMKGAFTHCKLAIVSNVSEMGRIANEEKLAVSFEPEDENSLVKCLKRVLNNGSEFYSDKINNANNYANKRDWSRLAKRFISSLE